MAGAYRLGPQSGRLLVHPTRTGLGAKAGHDLTIEVTRWHGHATVDTADPANCSVTIEVAVDSFQVREAIGGVMPPPRPTARRSTRPSRRSSTPRSTQPSPFSEGVRDASTTDTAMIPVVVAVTA